MGETIGAAVVGAGYWGPNLVRNIAASPRFRLGWLCDLDVERARAVLGPYSTVRPTASLDDVLDDPAIQAVAVATPAATHFEVALRVIESGRHLLVEKPLASSAAEARKLVDAAGAAGVVLMCDHTYCYTPAAIKIRELIQSGELGEIHFVDSVRVNLGLVASDVDVLWDLAPHDLSVLDFVLPPDLAPRSVAAHGADPIGAGRACIAYLTLALAGGAIAHAHVNWLSPTKIRTTIVGGSRRTLVWDDLSPTQRLSVYDRGVDLAEDFAADLAADAAGPGPDPAANPGPNAGPAPSVGTGSGKRALDRRRELLVSYRIGGMVAPALGEREALAAVTAEWADAIAARRAPRTDGWSGVRVLDVLEAASRSLERAGATVALSSDGPAR